MLASENSFTKISYFLPKGWIFVNKGTQKECDCYDSNNQQCRRREEGVSRRLVHPWAMVNFQSLEDEGVLVKDLFYRVGWMPFLEKFSSWHYDPYALFWGTARMRRWIYQRSYSSFGFKPLWTNSPQKTRKIMFLLACFSLKLCATVEWMC